MAKIRSWEVSEEFWKRVEPLIPKRERDQTRSFRRKPGAGRKPIDPRKVFEGIVYVLRTGCQWKALPKEQYGSASSRAPVLPGLAPLRFLPGPLACRSGRV